MGEGLAKLPAPSALAGESVDTATAGDRHGYACVLLRPLNDYGLGTIRGISVLLTTFESLRVGVKITARRHTVTVMNEDPVSEELVRAFH